MLSFCIGVASGVLCVLFVRLFKHGDDMESTARLRMLFSAARWLAQWNYLTMVAMEDFVLDNIPNINYNEIRRGMMAKLRMRRQYLATANQLIPMDLVPGELREAAKQYNMEVMFGTEKAVMTEPELEKSMEQQRIRQLQDAVIMLQLQSNEILRGVPAELASKLQSRAYAAASRVLGLPDPEEVLPSIY